MSLLPPIATPLESALHDATARLSDVPVILRDVWSPQTCPVHLLPWLAWGLSIDFWNTRWSEAQKRAAIAQAIIEQRRKGTRATLRAVLDRFDPLIEIVEWFEDRENLPPHVFRLELPLPTESDVEYNEAAVSALLADIAAVKPLRDHMQAVHRLRAQAHVGLLGAARAVGFARIGMAADTQTAQQPEWATYLQSEDGEPVQNESGTFLEAA